jgi:hypothetical protein
MLDSPLHLSIPLCKLPGRNELGLVAANPSGNLPTISTSVYAVACRMRRTVMRDLLVMLDRHFVVMRSRVRCG